MYCLAKVVKVVPFGSRLCEEVDGRILPGEKQYPLGGLLRLHLSGRVMSGIPMSVISMSGLNLCGVCG